MTAIAFITAFALSLALTAALLPLLKKLKAGQSILQYVTEHSSKQGTPTMGGIAFIVAVTICACLFCNTSIRSTAVAIAVFAAYGATGFLDDFIKIKLHRNQGLYAYQKIVVQLAIAVIVAFYAKGDMAIGDRLRIPFGREITLGWWIVPLTAFVFLACTNGVNLTDGIDGLAASSTCCFMTGLYLLLKREAATLEERGETLALSSVKDVQTLCVICMAALLAFLLFNANDAKVFMGDTGSLALGAMVACTAIFTRMSLFIPLLGLVFVISCLSVIVQVVYFKLTAGKRVFLMAPFHHHLQKKGWSETRICVLYCCITLVATAILVGFGE